MYFLNYALMAIFIIIGAGSTLVMIATLLGTIGFKIYRKVKFGISVFH